MKKRKGNVKLPKISIIILVIILICIKCFIVPSIRNKKISSQAINYANYEEKYTTIFCNGKNIELSDESYNKIKEENLDLIVYNKNYIAKIRNENVEKNINLDVKITKDKNYDDGYNVKINTNGIVELKINVENSKNNKEYISEFSNDELITNKSKIDDDGFTEIELKDGEDNYTLAYIVPESFEIEDMVINKGASKIIELNIDEKDYTYGSIDITTDNENAIEINEFEITAKEVGECKIYAKSKKATKEANVKIEQSVEKIELSSLTLEMVKGTKNKVDAKVTPDDAVNKELKWESSDEDVAKVDELGNIEAIKKGNCKITVSTKEEPIVSASIELEVKDKISSISQINSTGTSNTDGITYIKGIMLVNKTYSLPKSYAPGLQSVAYNAFLELKKDAAAAGYDISLLSGYRSYETQVTLYNNYVATYGQAEADTFSARPGYSEHQTGLSMDVGWIDDSYGDTASGKWLAANCYKYGFIIRFPKDKESITGYKYEPWHIRYLGKDIAKDVYESGLCLEEYLGVN
jgi:LAS superfamily LD-carboxypeptidase LdcB